MILSSLLFVRVYGELEFGFAMLKICLILIIQHHGRRAGCRWWPKPCCHRIRILEEPGDHFAGLHVGFRGSLGQFLGFWTTFSNAVYAYSGIEAITIACSGDPERLGGRYPGCQTHPLAGGLFYVLSIFSVGLVVPSDNASLLSGPGTTPRLFVIAAKQMSLESSMVLRIVLNAVVSHFSWSAGGTPA